MLHVQARLSRFHGASAISSADFYGNGEGGGPARTGSSDFDMSTNELMSKLSFQVCCWRLGCLQEGMFCVTLQLMKMP